MDRARLVLAVVLVCAFFLGAIPIAQTTPPDGWVVLPVDEYRALRDRANPPPTPIADPLNSCQLLEVQRQPGAVPPTTNVFAALLNIFR